MKPHDARNRRDLIACCTTDQALKCLFFWGHTPHNAHSIDSSCLSQWYPSPIFIDAITYPTAEHYMMAAKARLFGDEDILARILQAVHPGEAKRLGRAVRNFDNSVWERHAFAIVVDANLAKFSQHEPLKQFLLQTGQRILVEASPVDPIWGIGLSKQDAGCDQPARWRGENQLGFALMEVRDRLRTLQAAG